MNDNKCVVWVVGSLCISFLLLVITIACYYSYKTKLYIDNGYVQTRNGSGYSYWVKEK